MPLRTLLASLALAASATLSHAADATPAAPPNILILLADDLGWNAVGYHHGFVHTPNIDSIASRGVNLDRSYVSPMCSPTRAGIITGRYALHVGLGRSVVRPWANGGLPANGYTLPRALADAGYADRVIFGKWHLGHLDPKYHPLAQGFTHFEGCYNGAADYFTRDRDGQIDWHNDYADIQPPGYTTDIIADAASKFIAGHAHSDKPFFAYVAFTAVHEPAQAPQSYIDQYPDLKGDKKIMSGQDTCMDDGIGRILAALKDSGLADNTLIWFLSDNGGIRAIPENNFPLRAGKLTCYEGGIRTPAAVYWPGHIEGGRTISTPVVNVDLLPTLLHAATGVVSPADHAHPLDGVDLLDLLTNPSATLPPRDIFGFTGQQGFDDEQISVLSDGWKLIATGPDVRRPGDVKRKLELFHLDQDLLEKTDLADKEPQRVKDLFAKLVAFRATEPADSVPPMNKKPRDFTTPKNWHNAPPGK